MDLFEVSTLAAKRTFNAIERQIATLVATVFAEIPPAHVFDGASALDASLLTDGHK